jgi:hypothetical protein
VRRAAALELLVDRALLVAIDAGTVVAHAISTQRPRQRLDHDALVVAGVLPRVRQQIEQRAHERRAIADRREAWLELDLDRRRVGRA